MEKSDIRLMESLNYEGRTLVEGHSTKKYAWGSLRRPGLKADEGGTLPDGRKVLDVLSEGDITALRSTWLQVENPGVYGDMIWSTSMMTAFVSDRFVGAIRDAGFVGYQLLPLDVHPKRGEPFPGYSLLLPDNTDPDASIRSFPFPYRATVSLDVSGEVMATLRAAGVTDFTADEAPKRARAQIAAAWEDHED